LAIAAARIASSIAIVELVVILSPFFFAASDL